MISQFKEKWFGKKSIIVLKMSDPKFCWTEIKHCTFKIEIITFKTVHFKWDSFQAKKIKATTKINKKIFF